MNSAYPVLNEKAFYLAVNFLKFKQEHGTEIEQRIYSNMDILGLIQRLLEKRAAVFVGSYDKYLLQNKIEGCGGWDEVGTEKEAEPLLLQNCLSYDEMKLSALLSVSSHTVFINPGSRGNRGAETSDIESFQRHGVIIGLIGTRLPRPGVMEAQEVLITTEKRVNGGYGFNPNQKTPLYEWRKIWADFYGVEPNFPTFLEAKKLKKHNTRFVEIYDNEIFDNLAYQRRLSISFETLLLEAHTRAQKASTTAFVHIVGIGLGVWRVAPHQERQYLEAFISCVKRLAHVLTHVADLRFAWFSEDCRQLCPKIMGHIRVHFSNNNPQIRLEDQTQLLVVSYAWDSNSLPGNEFWHGTLHTSSDPAAASCSQVSELHNAKVNPAKVCASNLHLACQEWGVIHISEYARRKLSENILAEP